MPNSGLRRAIALLSERANEFADMLLSSERKRFLIASPSTIAESLHVIGMAGVGNSQISPEVFGLPKSGYARFHEKVSRYREANVLLALHDRLDSLNDKDGRKDTLFEPVALEYEKIIFAQSATTTGGVDRRQSVEAALKDLSAHRHPPMGNIYDFARNWSRKWFADIDFDQMNPEILSQFSTLWHTEYRKIQDVLEDFIQ